MNAIRLRGVILLAALLGAAPAFAQAPTVLGTRAYSGLALTNTTAGFDSTGASTLVAFLSIFPVWNGNPVSITGVTDNVGNTWNLLTGPTSSPGSPYNMTSALYYVNVPTTSTTHTVTVTLTNSGPLVAHLFAISHSDFTRPPLYSPITGTGLDPSVNVTSQAISVPADSLLLGWAFNGSGSPATAQSGFILDAAGSTNYLAAESQPVFSAGTYTSSFLYGGGQTGTATDWQTALVALRPAAGPLAESEAVTTFQQQSVNITLLAVSPVGGPLTYTLMSGPAHGTLSGVPPALVYTPGAAYIGSDAFTFTASDTTGTSNVATVSLTVRGPDHAPVASNSNVTVAGTSGTITLIASDVDNDPLTYQIVTPPAHGQLSTGTGPNRTYTPALGYIGSDSFSFKANDGFLDSNIAVVNITVQYAPAPPAVIGSVGYINTNPLVAHTTAAFNTSGASTLVAFVSSHPSWNGLPVSITGLSDSVGNTWNILTGPAVYVDSPFSLMSSIYYVTAPVTSATSTITVNLTNAAPLVVHVFSISGTDIASLPIYSAITDPGAGTVTSAVTSAAITVPADTLLLSWVKNDSAATATALGGYTLDPQSTSFLWAESQPALTAGSYTGDFQYDSPISWQTAVVGLKAPTGPVAFNQTVVTLEATPVGIALTAWSPTGSPLTYSVLTGPTHGTVTGAAPNLTYTPGTGYVGSDAFTFTATDHTGTSSPATVSLTVRGADHAPVASNSNVTVVGTSGAVTLVASDVDNNPLTYVIVTPPAHGQLSTGTGPTRTYTPTPGYIGSDSFAFEANDGLLNSNIAVVTITVQPAPPAPAIVSSNGYINGTPLTAHTTAAFNTSGASTLVAFVSTNTPWNGLPVSIGGLSDNVGNTWTILTGPTTYVGSPNTLLSAIYYVTAPVTSATHTITVSLTSAAPLVAHIFAVSGTDITSLPVYSPITDPGTDAVAADVTSAAITVPASTLLLSWVKNDSSATAISVGGYTLDPQSTSFLWAESQPALAAGTYTGDFQYNTAIGWQTAIVGLKPPSTFTMAWANPAAIVYGTALSGAQLNATATVPGTFAYTPAAGTVLGAGSGQSLSVTFTPADTTLTVMTRSVTINVLKATPAITWANPAPIGYGTALGAPQLNATASVSGTFTYSPPAGTVLGAGGGQTLSVTFTPTDMTDQATTSATVSLTVMPAVLTVTANPQTKVYGTGDPALTYGVSGFQLGDTAAGVLTGALTRSAGETVAGSPYAITQGTLASQTANYTIGFTGNVLRITPAAATVTAANAGKIYGAADPVLTASATGLTAADAATVTLSATRASGATVGTYAITPAATGAAISNYTVTYVAGTFTITRAPASVTPNPASKSYGNPDPVFTGTLTGFLAADGVTATYGRVAGETVAGSPYTINATLSPAGVLGNYNITYNTAAFTINKATPAITWANPAGVPVGTALGYTQLDATASTAGSFVYTPVLGTVLSTAPSQTLSVTFTPADTADYVTATSSVTINVVPAGSQTMTSSLAISIAQPAYSDPDTFTVSVTSSVAGQAPAGAVAFTVGSEAMGTAALLPVGNASTTTTYQATWTGQMVEPLPYGTAPTGQMKPGVHVVSAFLVNPNPSFAITNPAVKSMNIVQKPVSLTYSGPASLSLGGNTTVPLTVTLTDNTDAYSGDIRNAQVQFYNRATNTLLGTASVTASNANPTLGTATLNWTATPGTYTIGFVVTGYYTRNNSADNTTVTVTR
jgi:hypothetical protein